MKFLIAGVLVFGLLIVSVQAFYPSSETKSKFLEKRAAIVVRNIGHKLLHYAGDSSSRVLPVKELGNGVFQLEFQNEYSFMPDTLVSIVRHNLSSAGMPLDYMVHVFECSSNQIVYGFEIISSSHTSTIPCLGREQVKGCYSIQISFVDTGIFSGTINSVYLYIMTAFGFIGLVGFVYTNKKKSISKPSNSGIAIGKYSYFADSQLLQINGETIKLTDKESKLLTVLTDKPNELVTRDWLLQKVWEDDGVFTGRSLDVFISKLRKKLSDDPSVQLINVHGKGYKLVAKN